MAEHALPSTPYEAGGWARTFASLGSDYQPGAPDSLDSEWGVFSSFSWRLPIGLVVTGGLTAAALVIVLYYRPPQARGSLPPWVPFSGACCLTLLCLGASSALSLQWRGLSGAADALDTALQAFRDAGALASVLMDSGSAVSKDLDALYEQCPGSVRASLGNSVTKIKGHVDTYTTQVHHLSQTLSSAASWVLRLQERCTDAAGSLPACVPLPALLAIGCCIGVAIPLLAAADLFGEKSARRLGRCSLFGVSAALIAPAIVIISLVTAAELSLGTQLGTFCSQPDVAAADYVIKLVSSAGDQALHVANVSGKSDFDAGHNAFKLVRYYIDGEGSNPASELLNAAEAEMDISVDWVKTYAAPLKRVCPPRSMESMIADLGTVKSNLHKEKALLAPEDIHSYYTSAVYDVTCGDAISGLGWLVVMQAVLGLACLPALALTASCLLDGPLGRLRSREFHPVSREEDANDDEEGFDMLYHGVFIFSAFLFLVGALMYFIPSTRIIRRISGTLLFACGTFLITNSDLVVTYVRMKIQIARFEENNAHFAKSLDQQAAHIRTLQQAAQGLKEVDKKFQGNVQQAVKEVGNLKVTARTNIAMCARQLCRMYDDTEKDGIISSGVELDHSFELMGTVFGGIVDEYADREMRLRACLTFHPKYQQQQGLKVDVFAKLMEAALKEENADTIPEAVKRIMDKVK